MDVRLQQNAERMKALGHPLRLSILRLVVQGRPEGTPAGEIQAHVGVPASTLSHHLACLAENELVRVEREGTTLRYQANFDILHQLTQYLWEDCCRAGQACERSGTSCCTSS